MVDALIAQAYDAIASEYDVQLARNPVAVEMRRQLHVHFDLVFRPGDSVLDFTAGTGGDALYLAARGIAVTALDISPNMIAELQRKSTLDARVLPAERLAELGEEFDGAVSTFAGLNTIEHLPRLARDLAACVKPHGRVILHALNAFCFWQAIARSPRSVEMRVGATRVSHRLYHPMALWREAFAPYFGLREVYALSVIAAPALVQRAPRYAQLVFRVDRVIGKLFPAAGDFFVMDLERSDERTR